MTSMNNQPPQIPESATPAPPSGPLTPEHMQIVAAANQRAGKLRSAAGLAKFNMICAGVFSGLSLLCAAGEAAFGEFDWVALVMGVGLGAVAWNESRGRKMLLQFNTRAPFALGFNQLAMMVLIIAYAAWMMAVGLLGPNPYEEAMQREPMLKQMLGDIGDLYKTLTVIVYGSLIAATVIFQGINSLYYFTRARILRAFLAETPAWVVQLQQSQAAGM